MSKSVRRLAAVTLAGVLAFLVAPNAFGQIGRRLTDLKTTDFFTFFHLKQVESKVTSEQARVIIFQTMGGFRELVRVVVTTDDTDRIFGMTLLLKRSFLDHPTSGIFARDLAKGLLLTAIPRADQGAVAELVNDIRSPTNTASISLSPAYLTFLGRRKSHVEPLSQSTVLLENSAAGSGGSGGDELIISVSAK